MRRRSMPCAITFCLASPSRRRIAAQSARASVDAVPGLAAVLLAISLLFVAAPMLDLWTSGLFAASEGGFPLAGDPLLIAVRDLNRALPVWIVPALVAALAARALGTGRLVRRLPSPSFSIFALATYAVAPLGIVHLLKNTVGRARPQDIVAFGGQDPFTAAWQISDACLRNCSFSSGEAASAAMLPLLALALPRRLRIAAFVALACAAVIF